MKRALLFILLISCFCIVALEFYFARYIEADDPLPASSPSRWEIAKALDFPGMPMSSRRIPPPARRHGSFRSWYTTRPAGAYR